MSNLENIDQLNQFLAADKTDQNEWKEYYFCSHYTQYLVRNAESYNILLGGAIVSNHPVFGTDYSYNTYIINYVYINNEIIFIDSQTDGILRLSDVFFKWEYIRLYHDGIQTPSYWNVNFAPTMKWDDYNI